VKKIPTREIELTTKVARRMLPISGICHLVSRKRPFPGDGSQIPGD